MGTLEMAECYWTIFFMVVQFYVIFPEDALRKKCPYQLASSVVSRKSLNLGCALSTI